MFHCLKGKNTIIIVSTVHTTLYIYQRRKGVPYVLPYVLTHYMYVCCSESFNRTPNNVISHIQIYNYALLYRYIIIILT